LSALQTRGLVGTMEVVELLVWVLLGEVVDEVELGLEDVVATELVEVVDVV